MSRQRLSRFAQTYARFKELAEGLFEKRLSKRSWHIESIDFDESGCSIKYRTCSCHSDTETEYFAYSELLEYEAELKRKKAASAKK